MQIGRSGAARRSKVAVVCGGGGITGGVFEVGALRALDRALGGGVVNDVETYAGASAGALVATLLAAGVSPIDMDHVIVRGSRNRLNLPPLKRTSVYGLDLRPWAASAARMPLAMGTGFLRSLLPGESSRPADALYESIASLPAGVFSNAPLGRFMETALEKLGMPRTFEGFPKELLIAAVNVDTGHRIVFGEPGAKDIPISRAIQASAAVPLLFLPVRIEGQDFIDGGVERNLPVDAAIQAGAELVIAVNPMVPVVNDPRIGGSLDADLGYLRDRGLAAIADQVFRMLIRSQVVYGLQQMRERFPEVDIVLIEPEANDYTMFAYHPMRYSVRQEIARHAYGQTRERLLRESESLTRIFARHGLDFDPGRLGTNQQTRRKGAGEGTRSLFRMLDRLPGLGSLLGDEPEPF